VPSVDTTQWPNEIYVGYATGWMRRYDQEFDPDNPAPQKLLADYKEATAAPQTELIDQADRQRDALIAQVSTMIEAMLKMTLMPQKQQAAQTLKTGWDIYKPTAKAALRERLRVGELARESNRPRCSSGSSTYTPTPHRGQPSPNWD
jgi:hypothetical protein